MRGRAQPAGLVGELGEAREEKKLAEGWLARTEAEADMLKLLLDRLRQAYDDASRQFLGPVTRRAAAYVGRIFPASELAFAMNSGSIGSPGVRSRRKAWCSAGGRRNSSVF
jgi:hypothetical protein